MKATGNVEQLGNKEVNTRFGPKQTYSAKVAGKWYKFGFKDPKLSVGDSVEFDYTPGKYGDEADTSTIVRGGSTPPAPAAAPAPASPSKAYSRGSFPIDALDGQRSICRQNALTNAREFYVNGVDGKTPASKKDMDKAVEFIIKIARQFEAYTAGDMDMEMAKASLEAEAEVKH